MENWQPKMARFHRETKKEEAIWSFFVTDGQTEGQRDRQTESIVDNNRLLG